MADEEHGMSLSAWRCSQLEVLLNELVETIGTLHPMLELASQKEGDQRSRYLKLARKTSARGTFVLKMLLWQWRGLRDLRQEQAGLVELDQLRKEFQLLSIASEGETGTQ